MFLQGSLFGLAEPSIDDRRVDRTWLDDTTWIDHSPTWLAGADDVFDELFHTLPWEQRRGVKMYDRLVDEPRLVHWWSLATGTPEPMAVLGTIRHELSERYGVAFDSIGFNLYRDGDDSVAWHGDRHRHRVENPVVAILSVGAARPLRLRPRWRTVAGVEPRLRRSVRHGRRLPAPVGALRPQGARRRAAPVDHVSPRRPVSDGQIDRTSVASRSGLAAAIGVRRASCSRVSRSRPSASTITPPASISTNIAPA